MERELYHEPNMLDVSILSEINERVFGSLSLFWSLFSPSMNILVLIKGNFFFFPIQMVYKRASHIAEFMLEKTYDTSDSSKGFFVFSPFFQVSTD